MRAAAFAGIIALLSCRTAFALHPANATAVRRIAAFIADAKQEHAALTPLIGTKKKKGKLDRLKKSLGLLLMSGDEDNADFYKRQIAQVKAKIKSLRDARDVARDKAIHLALTAYGIVPAGADGRPEEPVGISRMQDSENGRRISWIPVAMNDGRTRIPQSASGSAFNFFGLGRLLKITARSNLFALTGTDGVTTVDRTAFLHGPGYLALTLAHELVHFRQYTTPGRGSRMSYAEREVEAWRKESKNLAELESAGQITGQEKIYAVSQIGANLNYYKSVVARQRWISWLGKPQHALPIHTQAQILEARSRFDDLSRIMAQETASVKAEARRQEQAAQAQQALRAAFQDQRRTQTAEQALQGAFQDQRRADEARDQTWCARRLAVEACADPTGLTEGDIQACRFPETPQISVPDRAAARAGLDACSADLYDRMLAQLTSYGGRGVTLIWLRIRAGSARPKTPDASRPTPPTQPEPQPRRNDPPRDHRHPHVPMPDDPWGG
jgi:hypothetical protein